MIRHSPAQLSFPGLDPTPRNGLFFAVLPDEAATRRAASISERLRNEFGQNGRLLDVGRLHVSLHPLGAYISLPTFLVAKAREAAGAITEEQFNLAFDRAGSFWGRNGSRPLVLRCGAPPDPLIALRSVLGGAMASSGLSACVASRFTPHMTLGYGDRHVEERIVEPVEWTVREFALVRSYLRQGRYSILGRWALRE